MMLAVADREEARRLGAQITRDVEGTLPGLLGIRYLEAEPGRVTGRIDLRAEHLSRNGFLHGGTIVGFADSLCGAGAFCSLPEGAEGWATAELKANLIGTVREGAITGEANLIHDGRSTQVWDAEVAHEGSGRTIALFRCTQLILYPGG